MKKKTKNGKFFREKLPLYYYLIKNDQTPKLAKALIGGLVIYILAPLDIVPDTIPLLGLADDIALIPLIGMLISNLVPTNIWNDSIEKTKNLWFNSKKLKNYKIVPDCRQSRWKTQIRLLFLCRKRLNQAIFGYKYTKDGGSYAT